jgi:hypothetical protein
LVGNGDRSATQASANEVAKNAPHRTTRNISGLNPQTKPAASTMRATKG